MRDFLLLHKSTGICPIPLNLCGFCGNRADLQEKHMKNKHRPQRSSLTSCLGETKGTRMVIAEKEQQMNGAQGFYSIRLHFIGAWSSKIRH